MSTCLKKIPPKTQVFSSNNTYYCFCSLRKNFVTVHIAKTKHLCYNEDKEVIVMKSYKISVPVMLSLFQGDYREKAISELKRIGAERVFLAIGFYRTNQEKRKVLFEKLKDAISYLKEQGFEAGVWMWSVLVKEKNDFRKLTDLAGVPSDAYVCPTDKDFEKLALDFISDVAKCSPDLIMFISKG